MLNKPTNLFTDHVKSMRTLIRLSTAVICLTCTLNVYAQGPAADTASVTAMYDSAMAGHTRLYNGAEYAPYPYGLHEGSSYLESGEMTPGNIFYDGQLFRDVRMVYDQVKDQLVVAQPGGLVRFYLIPDKLSSFELHGRRFVRIVADSTNHRVLSTGFFEIHHDGNTKVYTKTLKIVAEAIESGAIKRTINTLVYYYVYINGRYHAVKKEGSVLALLGEHKKEVRQYLRKNKIRYKKQKATAIAQTMAYYDQLTR